MPLRSKSKAPVQKIDVAVPEAPTTLSGEELRELIALRAYEIYQEGSGGGNPVGDWLKAEVEVLACLHKDSRPVVETLAVTIDVPIHSNGARRKTAVSASKKTSNLEKRKPKPKERPAARL